jgi:glycosyltransferase involved in cell wall biosynthesis
MKILMISSYLPYPLFSGGQVRLYNLIKELSAKHEITLICEKRPNQTEQDIHEVEKICKKVITVDRQKQWTIKNILKSGTSASSFLVAGHTNLRMKQLITEELANSWYDLVHVETYYVFQNLPKGLIPVVLVEHNIEYKVYEKYLQRAPAFLRPLLAIDVLKIRKEEEFFWKEAEALVAVSSDDQHVMEKSGVKPALVSNGVNTDQFSFKDIKATAAKKEKKILFIGDFKWIQNRDSASFIIKEIWPEIQARIKKNLSAMQAGNSSFDIKLWIIGRSIPESIKSLSNDPNILFDEESSSRLTPELFQEADILLAPIRVGGGTSYKILESMSCGTPVVTMQMSADAINATHGENIAVGKDAKELAEQTIALLSQNNLYEKIAVNGRQLIEKNYTWSVISKKLEAVYLESVQK